MTITVTPSFSTADGSTFPTRKLAQDYQDTADRTARVTELLNSKGLDPAIPGAVDAASIAGLGKELIAALTLPSKMGPKPKPEAAAPAA